MKQAKSVSSSEKKARNKHLLIIFVPPCAVSIRLASPSVGFLEKRVGTEICLHELY